DGADVITLADAGDGVESPNGIAVLFGGNVVCWSQGNTIRCLFEGSVTTEVTVDASSSIKDIDLINGEFGLEVYWAEDGASTERIARYGTFSLGGDLVVETLYTISSTPIGVTVATNLNKVFWTTAGKVEYGAMNGSTAKTTIVTGLNALKGIDFKQTN
ncbi:MAG: hypothetical protein L0Z53_23540, partial [Acidobacteriales bacterium]|nr:hypothetical protein [Terriglobales bacterium]